MKRLASFGIAIAALLVAATAFAADAAPATAASPGTGSAAFSSLPNGRVPDPPSAPKPPTSIPSSEKAPGFFLARSKNQGHRGNDYAVLAATAERAREMVQGRGFGSGQPAPNNEACFTQAQQSGFREADGESTREWNPALQPFIMMAASAAQGARVEAVHSERLVQEPGRVALETIDAWVDPTTRGTRLIGRATLPLTRVAMVVGGGAIYAGKDGRKVHVVFVNPPPEHGPQRDRGLFATIDGGFASSQCAHLRVSLETERGQGRTATFVTDVHLPALDAEGPPAAQDKAKAEPRAAAATPALGKLGALPENRVRPVHVHTSVSWASRDAEPLLTVASGWDARERLERF